MAIEHRLWAYVLAVALAAIGLVGCGDDDRGEPGTDGGPLSEHDAATTPDGGPGGEDAAMPDDPRTRLAAATCDTRTRCCTMPSGDHDACVAAFLARIPPGTERIQYDAAATDACIAAISGLACTEAMSENPM